MDEPGFGNLEMRPRAYTFPCRHFVNEEQPPEPFQIQYEDSNHSAIYNRMIPPLESTQISQENWADEISQSSIYDYTNQSSSNFAYQQNVPSSSATNFASLMPANSEVCYKEEEEAENQLFRQRLDSSRKMNPVKHV